MAFDDTQKYMEESAPSDRILFSSALVMVKKLMEDYIINVVYNRENPYTINWIYTDADEATAPQPLAVPSNGEANS